MRARTLLPLLASLLLACPAALAQDELVDPADPAAPPAAAAEESRADLHKIYVPYDKLDEVLGTDKERVLVPYDEFLELWKLKYGPKRASDQPPVPFTVESAVYEGRVTEGIAKFTATIEVEVLADGWQRIPLPFTQVAFDEVTVDGEPAVLVPSSAAPPPAPEVREAKARRPASPPPPGEGQGYDLVLRGTGRRTVVATFVAGVERGKELATTRFGLPPVPLHRLTFRVPGRGTDVTIEPARAHTTADEGDETVLLAFLGPQAEVRLTWRYQPEETEREPALVFSEDRLDVRVEERVMRGQVHFGLEVLRSPVREFTVRIPEGLQVLSVEGARIRTWSFLDDERTRLRVALREEVEGAYELAVGFEGPVEVPGTLVVPAFAIDGAAREHGTLRVSSAEGVGLRPVATENAFQVDLSSLPDQIRGGERALGFRFPSLPFSLSLQTERIAPLVTLEHRARLEVDRRTVKLDAALRFEVERAGVFTLRLVVPEGLVLTDVGDGKLIDNRRESVEEGRRILTLDLKGRRIGSFALPIRGVAPLDLEGGALAVPLLTVLDVDREEGTLGVFMDPGIKAVATTTGMIPLEPREWSREDSYSSAQPLQFAWRWRGTERSVDFAVEARKPKVTCAAHYRLQAEEGRVRMRTDLVYTIEYTGVETFRFRVPKSISEDLKVESRNLREKSSEDDPVEEGEEPTVTWTVSVQSPALGTVTIELEADTNFPKPLETNERRTVAVPAVVPLDVERTDTWVAVRKAPVIKVGTPTAAYEQVDASELPSALRSDDVFLALRRFDRPEAFPLELEKHEYQPVADLVVRHTHLETVLTDEPRATTTAYFEIFNNDRQFLAVRLPEGNDVLELRVAGKPETPRIGSEGVLLVPLRTGLAKDETFQVAIAYTHPVETRGVVFDTTDLRGPVLPAWEESPAPVQALLTWAVHYPDDWQVSGFGGNVTAAGADAHRGSWLGRAIASFAHLLDPGTPVAARAGGRRLGDWESIVPMYKERDSVRTLFVNGTGDGAVSITHTTLLAELVFVVLAVLAGLGAVLLLARAFPPMRAGGALCFVALVLLAMAGRGWVPVWNGFFFATLVATIAFALRERRRARA